MLAREGEKDEEKDEDFEKVKVQLCFFFLFFFCFFILKWSHLKKKKVLAWKKSEGGFEMLDYLDMNNTFKINWIKKCVLILIQYVFLFHIIFLRRWVVLIFF